MFRSLLLIVAGCRLLAGQGTTTVATIPSEAVLAGSIAHHDPDGRWATFDHTLVLRETRPDGDDRDTRVTIDLPGRRFAVASRTGETRLVRRMEGDRCSATLNGSDSFSPDEAREHRLTCDQIRFYRDYYTFLWGLPMKLRDPGARVDPEAWRTRFQDREALAVRVTYDPEIGNDIWTFYFDASSRALVGYRFTHGAASDDGEYVVLEGEYALEGLRLPRRRTWYRIADDALLGTDELVGHE